MWRLLPAPVRGVIVMLLYTFNTIGCFTTMIPVILLKVIIPHPEIRGYLTRVLMWLGTAWISLNSIILRHTQNIQWDVEGLEGFKPRASYLVISNHRSWADIFVLQHLFNHRIPYLKFFLKKELIWVPIMGVAWWALDFPYMKRYSREFIAKHPELKGKDIETTRKYCERFRKSPISVINFLEGTRFDHHKHKKQKSPYRHLLLPRAGGVAIVLSSMGETLDRIIDVTIVYPENGAPLPFWDFLTGKIPAVTVRVRSFPVQLEFIGRSYEDDKEFQEKFRGWINNLWAEKDRRIAAILGEEASNELTKAA